MPLHSVLRLFPFLLCASLLVSCAGQVPPSGGPVDTIPPEIVSVYPAPNTTFFTGQTIAIEFSEYVDRRSLEESVFISPFVGPLEFDWSGTEVEISFSEALREKTTYVVSIGTDVVDTRNKNRMAAAFTLAFSTGAEIDRGSITGTAYPAKRSDPLSGIMIWAYNLDLVDRDTLNPRSSRPDYITQSGKGGGFSLKHLAFGEYRVFAVRDEYKNLLYDPQTDEIGASQSDIQLSLADTMRSDLLLRLAREDTTAPRLVKITGIHERMVVAEFSKDLDTSTVHSDRFVVSDTAGTAMIEVLLVSPSVPKRNSYFLVTRTPFTSDGYRLTVNDVLDSTGLVVSPLARSLDFAPTVTRDTLAPAVRLAAADSTRNLPLDPHFLITLSEPVMTVDWREVVELRDSLNRPVPVIGGWIGSAGIWFRPEKELQGLAWYRFLVSQGGLVDFSGNRADDTVRAVNFHTLDAERFSTIEGTVVDRNRSDTIGAVILRAAEASGNNPKTRQMTVEKGGIFVFDRLLEGSYVLDAFRDRNGNGLYDAGKAFPFVSSERFTVHPDTLKLRARWPLEGVTIELK